MDTDCNIIIDPYNQNKLCALVSFPTSEPVKVSYVVRGKTNSTSFTWSASDYTDSPQISIVGLYANHLNHIDITTLSLSGNTDNFTIEISTQGQDYGDTPLNLTINILDQTLADNTLGQGWFVTSEWNGYDINGDLRITGLYPWMYGNLKIIDNSLWSALASETYDPEKHAFAPHLYNFNLMGKVAQTLTAPEGFGFHHDITTDHNGNLYVLGSVLDNWSDTQKLECIIYKYAIASGELLWQRDYSNEFMHATVLDNTDTNDVHFNSLEYIPQTNQLMVNSRSTCTIIGLNIETGDPEWMIDNPEFPTLNANINLSVKNPDNFKYPNGEHAVFITNNDKYADYQGENKFVISMFNNNSCADENGNELVRLIESEPVAYTAAELDSLPTIFAVDLNEKTVQRLDQFTFPGQRSELTSSVFETGENYCVYFGAEQSFFVFDTDNTTGVSIFAIDTGLGYRGRIFSYDELRSLI